MVWEQLIFSKKVGMCVYKSPAQMIMGHWNVFAFFLQLKQGCRFSLFRFQPEKYPCNFTILGKAAKDRKVNHQNITSLTCILFTLFPFQPGSSLQIGSPWYIMHLNNGGPRDMEVT